MAIEHKERLVRTVLDSETGKHVDFLNAQISDFEKKRLNTRYIAMPVSVSKVAWVNMLRAGCNRIVCITDKPFTRAPDCIINIMFENANESEFAKNEYCEKNCLYKCIKGQEYKRREV